MITANSRIRLRPGVAFVPLTDGSFQFFQGATRRSRVYRIREELARAIAHLDGIGTLAEVAASEGVDAETLVHLGEKLHEDCLAEDAGVAARVAQSHWRRVLNFIGDYVPSNELESAFEQLRQTSVILIGVGAVGSWIAVELARSGICRFTLVDDDLVETSNLNRSLYSYPDVGQPKVNALAKELQSIDASIEVLKQPIQLGEAGAEKGKISGVQMLRQLIQAQHGTCVVINAADQPSVDATSALIDAACKSSGTPYVIAGGYNLHLSLVGMTVIPGESACYHCGRMTLEEAQNNELDDMRKIARPWRNIGNLGPLAAITASFAANEALRLALPRERIKPAMLNRRGEFNFLTNQMHFTDLPRRDECGC